MVDRSAYDKIIQAGGFVSVNTGGVPDANATPIPKADADMAMDAAACIGCGACAAACKNGSAMLFVSAKVSQLVDDFVAVVSQLCSMRGASQRSPMGKPRQS